VLEHAARLLEPGEVCWVATDVGVGDASPQPPGMANGVRVGVDGHAEQQRCLLATHDASGSSDRVVPIVPVFMRGDTRDHSWAWWDTGMPEPAAAAGPTTRRPLPAMLVAGVVGLVLGYVALLLVNAGIELIWEDVPASWDTTPAWYVIGVLLLAAVLVYVVRRFVGDTGHSPIGGIAVSALTPRDYVGAILAILASLWGGIVLGPEVALVATGSMVGTVTAKGMRITDPATQTKVVGFGALGAILALLVGPILSGSFQLGSTPTSIELAQLGWAIPIAIIASVAVTLSRLLAAVLARAAGPGPHLPILVAAALTVAVSALLLQSWTGESVMLVVTSGEEMISDLPTITTCRRSWPSSCSSRSPTPCRWGPATAAVRSSPPCSSERHQACSSPC